MRFNFNLSLSDKLILCSFAVLGGIIINIYFEINKIKSHSQFQAIEKLIDLNTNTSNEFKNRILELEQKYEKIPTKKEIVMECVNAMKRGDHIP